MNGATMYLKVSSALIPLCSTVIPALLILLTFGLLLLRLMVGPSNLVRWALLLLLGLLVLLVMELVLP